MEPDPTTENEGFRAWKAGAAAERERIRQLADHHRVMVDMGSGHDPVPFADVIAQQP